MIKKGDIKRIVELTEKMDSVVQANYDNRVWKIEIHQASDGKVQTPFQIESDGVIKIIHEWKDEDDEKAEAKISSTVIPIHSPFPEPITGPYHIDSITYPGSKYEESETYENQKKFFFLLFMVFAVLADIQLHMVGLGSEESTLGSLIHIFDDPIISSMITGAIVVMLAVVQLTKGDQSMVRFDVTRQLEDPGKLSKVGGIYMPCGYDIRLQEKAIGATSENYDPKLIAYHKQVLRFNMNMMQSLFKLAQQSAQEAAEHGERFRGRQLSPGELEITKVRDGRVWDSVNGAMILGAICFVTFVVLKYYPWG